MPEPIKRDHKEIRIGVKFKGNNEFQAELRKRVDSFFAATGLRRRDLPQMYFKTGILFAVLASSYVLLVFFASAWWQAVPLSILLGLTMAAIGFNVQHDGGHQAYSDRPWVNKVMSLTLDLIGGSSYLWHYKHGVYHHTYVNITHEDTDIDLGVFARVTPHQRRRWYHRWQHFYIWPLYGLFVLKWHLFDDFKDLATGKIGEHRFPRPKGWELVFFIVGKAVFLSLALGVPLLLHRVWIVFLFYGVVAVVLGSVLSLVFQLAHAVEEAEFPVPVAETGTMENAWAIHQVETTVDFARHSRLAAWLLGGLNFQIEHHLLPKIAHVNFPAISRIVEETCAEYGIQYHEHATFWAGVASHFRWLKRMGRASEREVAVVRSNEVKATTRTGRKRARA